MRTALLIATVAAALASSGAARAQDADRGREAIGRYGCAGCHEIPGFAADAEQGCVSCHQQVRRGPRSAFSAGPHVEHFVTTPSLAHVTQRLSNDYLVRFLMDPHDVRPRLEETMPRLPVEERDARDIVAYLAREAPGSPDVPAAPAVDASRVARGEQVFRNSGCPACHAFGNYDAGYSMPPDALRALGDAARLAPNLRFVRDRLEPDVALAWIRDPRSIDPGAHMEDPELSDADSLAVRDFLYLGAPGAPAPLPSTPTAASLEPLGRRVRFAEVRRLFGRSCIHCHSHADDASAATSLGFREVALDLSSWEGVHAGALRPDGTRQSVLTAPGGGTPPLLARLLRRHAEAPRDVVPWGRDTLIRAVRPRRVEHEVGMPLGLPPLSVEDLRVIATWIAQGAPR